MVRELFLCVRILGDEPITSLPKRRLQSLKQDRRQTAIDRLFVYVEARLVQVLQVAEHFVDPAAPTRKHS